MVVLGSLLTLRAGPVLSAPIWLPVGFPSHHPLPLPQEKERNAKRKKKKGTAVQNEEATFPPAAEDEEMEVSGTSGNEEEMAEEAEGEAAGGLRWGDALSSPGFAVQLQQRHRTQPLQGCKCQRLQGVMSVTPKPHRGDGILQHELLMAFGMPLDFMLERSALDHCPPPVSVWRDVYFGKVVQCRSSVTSSLRCGCQAPTGIPGGMGRLTGASVAQGLLGPHIEAAHKGLTWNLERSQQLLLAQAESKPFGFQFPSAHAP